MAVAARAMKRLRRLRTLKGRRRQCPRHRLDGHNIPAAEHRWLASWQLCSPCLYSVHRRKQAEAEQKSHTRHTCEGRRREYLAGASRDYSVAGAESM